MYKTSTRSDPSSYESSQIESTKETKPPSTTSTSRSSTDCQTKNALFCAGTQNPAKASHGGSTSMGLTGWRTEETRWQQSRASTFH